jgi:hypothetical protein
MESPMMTIAPIICHSRAPSREPIRQQPQLLDRAARAEVPISTAALLRLPHPYLVGDGSPRRRAGMTILYGYCGAFQS